MKAKNSIKTRNNTTKKIIAGVIIIIAIITLIYLTMPKPNGIDKKTTECIASKSILYISTGCTACAYQEKLIGDNFKYLNTIDCAVEPGKCEGITGVPAWVIYGETVKGVQSIQALKELTGC